MEIIISLLMGTRLLTLLGGGLGHQAAEVAFLPPRIILTQEEIRLSCSLVNAYPEELKKLVKTATPVLIYLFFELREENRRQPVKKITVESTLVYDMIAKTYCVTQSTRPDTVCCASLDTAIAASCNFSDIPVAVKKEITHEGSYSINAFAVLGKTRVEALNNKEIDCMYFWDFKRPHFATEKIKGERFFGGTKQDN